VIIFKVKILLERLRDDFLRLKVVSEGYIIVVNYQIHLPKSRDYIKALNGILEIIWLCSFFAGTWPYLKDSSESHVTVFNVKIASLRLCYHFYD